MAQELKIDPALRERMMLGIFVARIGKHDMALMEQKYTREQMLSLSKPYGIFVDTIVGLILAEGGTLPGAVLVGAGDDDPLG